MSLVVGGILAGLGLASWSDELLDKAAELLFDGAGKRVLEETQARLRAYTGGIPPNHDLEHAIRFAEVTSTLVLLEAYRRQNEGDRFDTRGAEPPPFIAAARKWLHDQIGLCPSLRVATNDELVAELDRVLDQSVASTRREEVRQTMANAQQQVWDDLTAGAAENNGGKPPVEFAQLFFGDDIGAPGWSITFVAFIREALKKNAKAEVAFVTTRLAAARTSLDRVETKISAVKDNTEVLLRSQEAEAARAAGRHAEVMATVAALAEQVSVEKGVPLPVLREILSRLGEAEAPLDAAQIEQRLRAKAEDYQQLRERLGRLTNDDPRVQELRHEAAGRIDEGRFDEADASLAKAEAIDLAAVEELESIALRRRASAAASRAERAAAARLRLSYRAAAAHFAEAATIVANDDGATWNYRLSQAEVLYDQGSEFGDNAALSEAIGAYRDALRLVPRDRAPLQWATTQNSLGTALATLGERESGTARLEQAVAAYNEALKEWTRERVPLDWAGAQNNLGNALRALGGRESGTARLEEAVAAYNEALKEWTRERAPLQWAMTQNNLGNALARLGERESGTARLEAAVAALDDALKEWTRERAPLDWAGAQNNLGIALAKLGARESGTARLEEAVAAYNEALKEWTRERAPLQWAMTQNNLGNALAMLGARESGTARLEEAVAAYNEALKEWTRERGPLQWAMTQTNLGNALLSLGERESGTARLEEAVAAYRVALEERTRDRVPLDWATSTGNQGVALMVIAERIGDLSKARAAVEQIEVALATMREGGHAPSAAFYEAQLLRARALLDRLTKS